MRYFELSAKQTPWSDYSDMLYYGMTTALSRKDGMLRYQRTGPWQPDFCLSSFSLLAVDQVKTQLERKMLSGVSFRPVLLHHIVDLKWTNWDCSSDEPDFYPDSGRPEDYLLERAHSPEAQALMQPVWELFVPRNGLVREDNSLAEINLHYPVFQPINKGYHIVSEEFKCWIEQNTENWFAYKELRVMER